MSDHRTTVSTTSRRWGVSREVGNRLAGVVEVEGLPAFLGSVGL